MMVDIIAFLRLITGRIVIDPKFQLTKHPLASGCDHDHRNRYTSLSHGDKKLIWAKVRDVRVLRSAPRRYCFTLLNRTAIPAVVRFDCLVTVSVQPHMDRDGCIRRSNTSSFY